MRIFAPLFALVFAALTWAGATPTDYTLVCDDGDTVTVIGALSVTDEGLHAMLLDGATCEDPATLYVLEDESLVVSLIVDDVEGTVTVVLGEGDDAVEAVADEVPQVALDGRLGAFERRAAAFERAALGGDGAGAGVAGAGDQSQDARESALDRRPETPAAAGDETQDAAESTPERPETPAGGRP